ncbi:MAG TPA: DUF6166 domain-containing protein [Candidatus Angelobacter sp.]|nr:DUF6166 domain-containing protein [Candidatus Angelobacter sp.]
MSLYAGNRTKAGAMVVVDGEILELRLDLRNHSPTGFDWGYHGSGAAQLALAILAHHLGGDEEALNLYQRFKWAVIAELPKHRWLLTSREIDAALQRIRESEANGRCPAG